jgi:hypothetical protein
MNELCLIFFTVLMPNVDSAGIFLSSVIWPVYMSVYIRSSAAVASSSSQFGFLLIIPAASYM